MKSQKKINIYGIRLPPIFPIIYRNFQSSLKEKLNESIFKKRIKNLPEVLKRVIFDYLKLEFIYNDFYNKIYSLPCIRLEYQTLRPLLPYIFAFPTLIKLCSERIDHFNNIYQLFKKKGEKNFTLFKKGNDFALILLCCFYK